MRKQLTPEALKLRHWLKALNIAKILFEEDGYFTDYLEEIEAFIRSVLEDQPSPICFEEILITTLTTIKIQDSLSSGQPVLIELGELRDQQ